MFLTERLEKCLRLSDFDESTWIAHESEGLFSRNMRKNTCFLVGGLIGFDYSSQGGRRNTDPKLIWGMSVTTVSNQGGQLKLLSLTKKLKELLAITKLLTVFDSYEKEEDALASFSG